MKNKKVKENILYHLFFYGFGGAFFSITCYAIISDATATSVMALLFTILFITGGVLCDLFHGSDPDETE